jgi:hypothetical protein
VVCNDLAETRQVIFPVQNLGQVGHYLIARLVRGIGNDPGAAPARQCSIVRPSGEISTGTQKPSESLYRQVALSRNRGIVDDLSLNGAEAGTEQISE